MAYEMVARVSLEDVVAVTADGYEILSTGPPHDHCRGRGHSRCRLSEMTGVSAWPAAPAGSRVGR